MLFLYSLLLLSAMSIGIAVVGPFMLMQRFSCLMDSLAHSSLLAFALAISTNSEAMGIMGLIATLFYVVLASRSLNVFSNDLLFNALNGMLLAAGIILARLLKIYTLDVERLLFGDLLLANTGQVAAMWVVVSLIALIGYIRRREWFIASFNEDLAAAWGVKVGLVRFEIIAALSAFTSVSLSSVGSLLIVSLLILPTAGARLLAKTQRQLIVITALLALGSSYVGMLIAFGFDLPPGPAIIIAAGALFVLAALTEKSLRDYAKN